MFGFERNELGEIKNRMSIIIRDELGQVTGAKCRTVVGRLEPHRAEILGALEGVKLAQELSPRAIVFEGDDRALLEDSVAHLTKSRVWFREVPNCISKLVVRYLSFE